ncbi:MAG: DUF2142 domain-containing protein [Caldilineaceae bacterium]
MQSVTSMHTHVTYRAQQLERRLLGGILALFLGIGLWYSLAVPPFETPDELFHYGFVHHLAQGNGLPIQQAEVEGPWAQEGSQAPLYYWIVGRLTAWIDQSDFAQLSVRNPRANIGDPLFPGNKNFMLYSAAPHPLRGANLALHIGRWFSLLLGLLTIVFTYATARLVFTDDRTNPPAVTRHKPQVLSLALIAVAWVAALPQFAFISASCSNDSLIIAVSVITLYWLARIVRTAYVRPIHDWEWLVAGLLLGLAALSKLQGLGLMPLAGLVVVWLAIRRRDWRLLLRAGLWLALPALIVAGWWYWRNYTLYGDWFGISHLLANNGQRGKQLTWRSFGGEFRGLRYSFWGILGWFNLLLPGWIYGVLDGVTLLALVGWPLAWWRTERNEKYSHSHASAVLRLLVSWLLIALAILAYWIYRATGSQGRLFFPALSAFMILLVWGLEGWRMLLSRRWQQLLQGRALLLTAPCLMVGASFYTLLVLLPASYGAPKPVAALPADARPIDVVYSATIDGVTDELYLLGLEIPPERYRRGERVPVTLYLQARAPLHADYQLFIQFLDETGREVGNLTTHPAWGRNPTSLWQPGVIYRDHYPVLVEGEIDARSPLLARAYIGFVDPTTEKSGRFPITARTSDGVKITEGPFLGHVAISPAQPPTVDEAHLHRSEVQLGNVIQLTGVELPASSLTPSAPFTLTVVWDGLGSPATDYTAFVHLADAKGAPAGGFDQAPAPRFPTSYWRAGDRILSHFPLTAPATPGSYAVWIGLYAADSDGALRLPITADAGQTTGDGEVLVGEIVVQ